MLAFTLGLAAALICKQNFFFWTLIVFFSCTDWEIVWDINFERGASRIRLREEQEGLGDRHTHTSAQCQGEWGCILHQCNLHPCSVATFTESQTSSREAEIWIWKHYCGECSWSTVAFWDQVEAREVWKARDLLGLKGWKCWEAQD